MKGYCGIERQAGPADGGSGDYGLIRRVADFVTGTGSEGFDIARLAAHLGVGPAEIEALLDGWCGLSITAFAAAVTEDHRRRRMAGSADMLDTVCRPPHHFDVQLAGTVDDDAGRRGTGLEMAYGFHPSPFGEALVLAAKDALCGLAFVDEDAPAGRRIALDDMMARWPSARFGKTQSGTEWLARAVFIAPGGGARGAVPVLLIGTPFDLRVWRTLLRIPLGCLVSYATIARHLGIPAASRAVGTANGRNPISFVVPCHRALRGDGALGGYYWGLTRKRALIAWEQGQLSSARV